MRARGAVSGSRPGCEVADRQRATTSSSIPGSGAPWRLPAPSFDHAYTLMVLPCPFWPGGLAQASRSLPSDRPGSAAMSASNVSPTLPSAFTAKRLSRPTDGSVAPAIQTARCRPDGSQRTSQLVMSASPADPGSAIAVTSPGPTSACQSAMTSRPLVGTHVFVAGSRAWIPVQKTTLRFVGSTTGRQTAGRAIGFCAPVTGSSLNETTGTLGGADATAGDGDAEGAARTVGAAGDGDGAARVCLLYT